MERFLDTAKALILFAVRAFRGRRGIAELAAKIAPGEPDEDVALSDPESFALDRGKNLIEMRVHHDCNHTGQSAR
jgi:hypothetical protein